MLKNEANLIDIIHQIRYVQSCIGHLMSPEIKAELWQKSKLRNVPSEDDDGYNSEEEIKSSKVKHLNEEEVDFTKPNEDALRTPN